MQYQGLMSFTLKEKRKELISLVGAFGGAKPHKNCSIIL